MSSHRSGGSPTHRGPSAKFLPCSGLDGPRRGNKPINLRYCWQSGRRDTPLTLSRMAIHSSILSFFLLSFLLRSILPKVTLSIVWYSLSSLLIAFLFHYSIHSIPIFSFVLSSLLLFSLFNNLSPSLVFFSPYHSPFTNPFPNFYPFRSLAHPSLLPSLAPFSL